MNAIALQRTVSDIIAEYEEKSIDLAAQAGAFRDAARRLETSCCVAGHYGGPIWGRSSCSPSIDDRDIAKALLVSGWKAIYSRCQIDRIATAKDKAAWERTIADPPPLTRETAFEKFGDYLIRARWHILRGLAEAFVDLDPAYKSHSKVKIGVAGLPKRVILTNVGKYGGWGRERLVNILNALAAYRGEIPVDHDELRDLDALHTVWGHEAGEVTLSRREMKVWRNGQDEVVVIPDRGVTIRKFKNGNAHVIFNEAALLDINRALAEFYGEVLPDAPDAEEEGVKPRASTAVSRDLAYYPTPVAVIEVVLRAVGIEDRTGWRGDGLPKLKCLEPSCGDGRIMSAIKSLGHEVIGYEVHAGRAAEARAKGLPVVTRNFLEAPEFTHYDRVVMNPPFAGQHWRKHLLHALRFLAPGGVLVCILPATAYYDHDVTREFGGEWHDLPVASFSESGTNVPTGYVIIGRAAK